MQKEEFNKYLIDESLLNEESLGELKKVTEDFPWFQAGWLLYLKNLKKLNSPEYEVVLKKVAILVPDRKHLYKYLNSELPKQSLSIDKLQAASSVYQLKGDEENESGNSLIDKFLTSNSGSLSKSRNEEEVPESANNKELLERSTAENDELITETLASIYFKQKNYEKAQEAYQKLSLKYPEKSVYFATRIKEIEVLKNIK